MNIEALEKMLAAGNDNAMLRFTLGKLYFDRSELDKALEHLSAAVRQDPAYSAAWKLLGRTQTASQNETAAIEAFRAGIAVAEEKGDKQAVKEMQVFLARLQEAGRKSEREEGKE